jgi:hypothetical protein
MPGASTTQAPMTRQAIAVSPQSTKWWPEPHLETACFYTQRSTTSAVLPLKCGANLAGLKTKCPTTSTTLTNNNMQSTQVRNTCCPVLRDCLIHTLLAETLRAAPTQAYATAVLFCSVSSRTVHQTAGVHATNCSTCSSDTTQPKCFGTATTDRASHHAPLTSLARSLGKLNAIIYP